MMFEAKYYDGKSSAGYPASVTIGGQSLLITYGNSLLPNTVEWLPEKIHANDFTQNTKVFLRYGDFPFQYLEVTDVRFAAELKAAYPNARFHRTMMNFVFSTGFLGLIILGLLFLGVLALSYFVILPAAAERVAVSVPVEWEKELGNAAYGKMVSDETIDTENSERINEFFKLLNYKSAYDIEISVAKENVVNAFALPGGKIVVYEGILREMETYQELTALLSHEFSHVELKHSTKNIFRSLSSYMLISILFGDAGGITAVVIQNADQLKQLGYSRSLEEEADNNGLKLMKQRRIDPQGMLGLFEALKEEGGDSEIPQFLSTHPLTSERMNSVKKVIKAHDYTVVQDAQLDSLWKEIKANLDN